MKPLRNWRSWMLALVFDPRLARMKRWLRERYRQLSGRRHVVSVFLQIDDPYSYILSHYLPSLQKQFDIELRLYLSEARGGEYQPAPGLLAEYAVLDCARLALELGIPFLDKGDLPPTEQRIGLSDAIAELAGSDNFNDEIRQALAVFWRGDSAAAAAISATANSPGKAVALVAAAKKLQQKLGHYNSAMLYYSGEWYWGVDRLHYLTERLEEIGAANHDSPDPSLMSITQAMHVSLPVKPPVAAKNLPPIELFVSPRSPYSYLSLQRTYDIADAFGVQLVLRPVLPMVMRGMKVPKLKLAYILCDSLREASRHGVPYGNVADPAGPGVERLFAVFQYAQSEKKHREFLLNACIAIWSEATDVATDAGMRNVTGRTGLFWPEAKKAMQGDTWRAPIEANRESMLSSGLWGVPTVVMGDFIAWGQDRDWMLVRHLEELCDAGEGILV